MTDVVYLPTPKRPVSYTDERVKHAAAAIPFGKYTSVDTIATIIDAAVQTDVENGIHRVDLYPLYQPRNKLIQALKDPGSVVERYVFELGQETYEHWQIRAVLMTLANQAANR